uniref:Uncharacterized protein n=1 Tax=Talaromyces marneffei PM1 TaxID=1077442 RepID=A0A093XSY4_TALMA
MWQKFGLSSLAANLHEGTNPDSSTVPEYVPTGSSLSPILTNTNIPHSQETQANAREQILVYYYYIETFSSRTKQVPGTASRRIRQANPRQYMLVEAIREAAPEGWDPYDNEYYPWMTTSPTVRKKLEARQPTRGHT